MRRKQQAVIIQDSSHLEPVTISDSSPLERGSELPVIETAVPLVKAATLDANGVYIGMSELHPDNLTDRHLPHINECDLPANKYYWDGKTFVPLAPIKPPAPIEEQKQRDAWRAIGLGFKALAEAGVKLPPDTLKWMRDTALNIDDQ